MKPKRVKKLHTILPKRSGRDAGGRVAVRHQGGRFKRYYRAIDWKRDKDGIKGKIITIEHDPNRSADIALVHYADGDKRYIIAPDGLKKGQIIIASEKTPIQSGNCM